MTTMLVQVWMRTEVITINPELRVERVWDLMERQRIRHLLVVKNGTLVGIITGGALQSQEQVQTEQQRKIEAQQRELDRQQRELEELKRQREY